MLRRALTTTGMLAVVALAGSTLLAEGQRGQAAQSLGSVTLPRAVMANGAMLAAGTYTVRVATQAAPAAVGLSGDASKWLEFVQGDQVRGRELASVLSEAEVIQQVVKSAPPASGASKVEVLRGSEYLRLWINRSGTHYLVHFAVASE